MSNTRHKNQESDSDIRLLTVLAAVLRRGPTPQICTKHNTEEGAPVETDYPEVCPIPSECGWRRGCQLERWGLKKGKELGKLHSPPCFLSLLRSIEEDAEAAIDLDRRRRGRD